MILTCFQYYCMSHVPLLHHLLHGHHFPHNFRAPHHFVSTTRDHITTMIQGGIIPCVAAKTMISRAKIAQYLTMIQHQESKNNHEIISPAVAIHPQVVSERKSRKGSRSVAATQY